MQPNRKGGIYPILQVRKLPFKEAWGTGPGPHGKLQNWDKTECLASKPLLLIYTLWSLS